MVYFVDLLKKGTILYVIYCSGKLQFLQVHLLKC